jgi:hypothetical protein
MMSDSPAREIDSLIAFLSRLSFCGFERGRRHVKRLVDFPAEFRALVLPLKELGGGETRVGLAGRIVERRVRGLHGAADFLHHASSAGQNHPGLFAFTPKSLA